MADRLEPADLNRVTTRPLAERDNLVGVDVFAEPVRAGATLDAFLDGLPDVLGVRQLRGLAEAIAQARRNDRPVIWAMGAHVVKAGLAPVLIDLLERKAITALVIHGAVAIHDWEIAAVGATSESVDRGLPDGSFGMATETGLALNGAAGAAAAAGQGLGEALGARMLAAGLPYAEQSLLVAAARLGVPVTIHVAIGADIVHQHGSADGAALGAATHTDFKRLVTLVGGLGGGVWVNCGSAVLLPEVFVKALSTARNLGHVVTDFCTANLDMIRHYRTDENVLRRPTLGSGRGFALTGQHEILVPLLAGAIDRALRAER